MEDGVSLFLVLTPSATCLLFFARAWMAQLLLQERELLLLSACPEVRFSGSCITVGGSLRHDTLLAVPWWSALTV